MESHHGDDLQVLQIRALSGQNLFGNKVGLVGGIPLQDKRRGKEVVVGVISQPQCHHEEGLESFTHLPPALLLLLQPGYAAQLAQDGALQRRGRLARQAEG